eukprot:TRINITY_DN17986_c0_g1_i1.p1 TRINITY_DN17986_c0_g1~~TRINITY_DN17986_c0_g1_i1.p1  ORF type:complete len:121 (-),score=33.02 TRINITY_DN17986_c0_g1_i1:65-427(-)
MANVDNHSVIVFYPGLPTLLSPFEALKEQGIVTLKERSWGKVEKSIISKMEMEIPRSGDVVDIKSESFLYKFVTKSITVKVIMDILRIEEICTIESLINSVVENVTKVSFQQVGSVHVLK